MIESYSTGGQKVKALCRALLAGTGFNNELLALTDDDPDALYWEKIASELVTCMRDQEFSFEADRPSYPVFDPPINDGCGFSVYRGILVEWDEDRDARIFLFIDALQPSVRKSLLAAHECDAGLMLSWYKCIPSGYHEGDQIQVGGDVWIVVESNIECESVSVIGR